MSIGRDKRQTERGKVRGHQGASVKMSKVPEPRTKSKKAIRRERIRDKRTNR